MLVSPLEWTNAKEQIFIRPRCRLAHQGRGGRFGTRQPHRRRPATPPGLRKPEYPPAYTADLAVFRAGALVWRVAPLPATAEIVAAFICAEADRGVKASTNGRRLAEFTFGLSGLPCFNSDKSTFVLLAGTTNQWFKVIISDLTFLSERVSSSSRGAGRQVRCGRSRQRCCADPAARLALRHDGMKSLNDRRQWGRIARQKT
jgi:hypothetical protein